MEILVVVGILGIVSLGTHQLMLGMTKEVSYLEARLVTSEFKNLMITAIGDSANCTRLLENQIFNSNSLSPSNPAKIPMQGLTLNKSSADYDLAQPGQYLDTAKRVTIEDIGLEITSGNNNRYVGNVLVMVKNTGNLVRDPKPIGVRIFVNTDPLSPAGAKRITTCGAGDTNNLRNILQQTRIYEKRECIRDNSLSSHKVKVTCPAGEFLLACQGGPGDQFEENEGFWVLPDFKTETCTLDTTRPACVSGQEWTEQRVIAICLPL